MYHHLLQINGKNPNRPTRAPLPMMEKKNAPAAVAPEPVASEPVTSEPVASEPIATEPVASEAIVAKPVASEGGASVNWASLMGDGPLHKIEHHSMRCITPFNGELYAIAVNHFESGRLVCTNNVQLEQSASTVNMETLFSFPELGNGKFYLVKSDGDLLLVLLGRRLEEGQPLVYHVDTESRSLHAVSNIRSCAFFVHYLRCISVDTRVHPTLRPGCIYYADLGYIREYFDDMKAWDEWPLRVDRLGKYCMRNEQRPYRLEDVLAAHCRRKEFNEYFFQIR
jgi:hypothetical protein